MKRASIVLITLAMMTPAAMAEDGAALYKAKCANCHGAAGQGKMGPAIKGCAGTAALLTQGGKKAPHAKPMAGISPEQAKAIGDYVAGLK